MSFSILSLLAQVRNEEVSQLYLHEQKSYFMMFFCLFKLHWFLFWKKNSIILQPFFIPERQQGEETHEERSRNRGAPCVPVYSTCNQKGLVICYCMWLKDAYIFQSIENAVRRVHEKIYIMPISFCIILFSIPHTHYAKI